MNIRKATIEKSPYGFQIVPNVNIPFRNSLLEIVCENLNVSSSELLILGLENIVPKGMRRDKNYESTLDQLEIESQKIFESGIRYEYENYRLLMALSSTKASASFLLSSNSNLVSYFQKLMTHPNKSPNQLKMSCQIPAISNQGYVTGKFNLNKLKLNVLIVDDEFDDYQVNSGSINQCIGANSDGTPKWEMISQWNSSNFKNFDTRQSVAGVGNCHVKISQDMANYLASKQIGVDDLNKQPLTYLRSATQGCQFSLLVHDYPAMAKGTFIVSSTVPEGYHMVIPRSAFQLGYSNLPIMDGTYFITLAVTMPSIEGVSRFGSQFSRSMSKEILEARKPTIQQAMCKLNAASHDMREAAKFFNDELLALSELAYEGGSFIADKKDWLFKVCAAIVNNPDSLKWALQDPTILYRMVEMLAERKIHLALGLGFIGQILTPLPDDTLPLHVISSIHAHILKWKEGNWYNGSQLIPHNAVGMVSSEGLQYIGILSIRGRYPIINHSEQCMSVFINRSDGIGEGCEFMSHQSASICNLSFDEGRNEKLIWRNEVGYLEVINHFVELMRDYPISKVQNNNFEVVNLNWGQLTRIIYENCFELGCSAITYLYAIATSQGKEKFKSMLPMIAEVSQATESQFGDQKYTIQDYKRIHSMISGYVKKYYQTWHDDSRVQELDNTPYIDRTINISKLQNDNVLDDAGTITESIRFVNSLHKSPSLMDNAKPTVNLQSIWTKYSQEDKTFAKNFKKELKKEYQADRTMFEEGNFKQQAVYFDTLREEGYKFTDEQFSAFWDLYYSEHDVRVVNKSRQRKYIYTCNTVWIIFSNYIISNKPSFSTLRVFPKKLSQELFDKIHTAFKEHNDRFETLVEFTDIIEPFTTERDSTKSQCRILKSVKTGEVIGYLPITPIDVEPSIWNCEFTPYITTNGSYGKTYYIRCLHKPTNSPTNNFEFQEGSIPFEELFNEGDEEYWESERRSWWNEFRSEYCQDDDEDDEDIDEIEGREYSQEVFDSAKYEQTLVKKYISMHNLPDDWQPDNIEKWFADNIDILDPF